MGPEHLTTDREISTSGSRWGLRTCLRKGCGRKFQPRQWNQRYCREPECLEEVKRWQATRRQRQRHLTSEGRQRHAEEERQRRKRNSAEADQPRQDESSGLDATADAPPWSRSNKNLPELLCDRPGCYEPPGDSVHAPAHYCGDACREAMRRVRDRERKYLARKTKAGRLKRQQEYQAAKVKRGQSGHTRPSFPSHDPSGECRPSKDSSVLGYGRHGGPRLGFSRSPEVTTDDSEATPGPRPRAPPAS
jgi:hypothetical protein